MRAGMASAALVMDEANPTALAANVKGLVAAPQLGDAMIANAQLFLD
jgi:hypothetical protein